MLPLLVILFHQLFILELVEHVGAINCSTVGDQPKQTTIIGVSSAPTNSVRVSLCRFRQMEVTVL